MKVGLGGLRVWHVIGIGKLVFIDMVTYLNISKRFLIGYIK